MLIVCVYMFSTANGLADGLDIPQRDAASEIDRTTLRAVLRTYVTSLAQSIHPDARVTGNFDLSATIKPPCVAPKVTSTGQGLGNRLALRLRCEDNGWTAYASLANSIEVPVWITTTSLGRSQRITAAQIQQAYLPLSDLRSGFVDASEELGDIQTRRPLPAGRVLYTSAFEAADLIAKGERVRINATIGSASITTLGKALADGAKGEQIPVSNLSSGRTVRAWVTSRGLVTVRPPPGD